MRRTVEQMQNLQQRGRRITQELTPVQQRRVENIMSVLATGNYLLRRRGREDLIDVLAQRVMNAADYAEAARMVDELLLEASI